ncbi:MAG: DUF4861 domain-containing protein [Balneolales bacterium]|nr:DUF4861 domain-containing protein [Balneolales bacterium]
MLFRTRMLVPILLLTLTLACTENDHADEYHFSVQNQLSYAVSEAAVRVDLASLNRPPGDCKFVLLAVQDDRNQEVNLEQFDERFLSRISSQSHSTDGNLNVARHIVPSQCDDLNGDGKPDELFFLADFETEETRQFVLMPAEQTPEFQHRTQAFLKVQTGGRFEDGRYVDGTNSELVNNFDIPNEQVQGSGWAHMEGPVWESDKVGYRSYLDARNRIDIFGKSMQELVLDTITQNYHQIHPWGTDVLVVGSSLGLGTVAAVYNGEVQTIDNWSGRRFEVPVNGPLRSIIRMTYNDWNVFGSTVDVVWEVEIHAGNRYTEQRVRLSGVANNLTLGTGIVKHPPAEVLHTGSDSNSLYAWTSGDQSDQGHRLDMGIAIPERYKPAHLEDNFTHLYSITPINGKVTYRYTSAWEFDHTEVADFRQHVRKTGALLTNPPLVTITN